MRDLAAQHAALRFSSHFALAGDDQHDAKHNHQAPEQRLLGPAVLVEIIRDQQGFQEEYGVPNTDDRAAEHRREATGIGQPSEETGAPEGAVQQVEARQHQADDGKIALDGFDNPLDGGGLVDEHGYLGMDGSIRIVPQDQPSPSCYGFG